MNTIQETYTKKEVTALLIRAAELARDDKFTSIYNIANRVFLEKRPKHPRYNEPSKEVVSMLLDLISQQKYAPNIISKMLKERFGADAINLTQVQRYLTTYQKNLNLSDILPATHDIIMDLLNDPSLTGVEMREKLARKTGLSLTRTKVVEIAKQF